MQQFGMTGLSESRLVEFLIHGVTAEFVRRARARRGDVTPAELVEMRIHGWGHD